ncbi:molybdenum cofactor guanylyltransferase MobA [Pseudoduganella sp. FT93W]|uniref:Molybdenum cofactor guanylyltransferase n=1 Tax=Duganella fentianensis TaxID=2692177 RepID=A0A845HT84_9BURK|nr:gephyrin-like molybdotransferase Glp [Duganella fentianensis]MYN44203.1 molybdenum cofactor guanylyltransferase MobA [Duganella fentianensis]
MSFQNQITGLILAGGRGSRMGSVDKGLQPFRSSTLVEHVIARLAPQVASYAINANRNLTRYQELAGNAPVLPDYIDGYAGPLAGLQIGLQFCPTELLLTVPCDSPLLPADLAARLHAALSEQNADVALAVTMQTHADAAAPQRQLHPVFALLRTSVLPQLEAYLASGERRMESWYKSLRVAEVLFDDDAAFSNVNTLDELQALEQPPASAAAPSAAAPSAAAMASAAAYAGSSAARSAGQHDSALHVEQAQRLIAEQITPLDASHTVPLFSALDRVLAQDVISPINVPAYDNSAMDGYALRGADLPDAAQAQASFKVIGIAYAGRPCALQVQAGECIRIMTGAAMPAGCDSVLPQELASAISDDSVTVAHGVIQQGANRRFAGEDLKQGSVALARGKLLRPADLGLIASLGMAEVSVQRKLRVAFFSTGDELRAPGQPLDEGSIYDSNRYTVFGMLTRLGCEVIDLGIVRDDPQALDAALRSTCRQADAIITSGGVSEGAADYTRDILASLGQLSFWKLAMRPGRPLAFGQIRDGADSAWLLGLPGNPVAVAVSFYLFARPALLAMMGAQAPQLTLQARAQAAMRKRPGRTEYQRGIISRGADGQPEVRLTGAQGSGILRSMTEANCMVVLGHEQGNVAAGEMVDVLLFEGLI